MEKPCLLHSSMAVNVREKVQKEPQTANPRRISDTGVPPFGQDVPDGAGEDGGGGVRGGLSGQGQGGDGTDAQLLCRLEVNAAGGGGKVDEKSVFIEKGQLVFPKKTGGDGV